MALLNPTMLSVSDHRRHLTQPPDDIRRRALGRLYERRFAVENLIHALERYQQEQSQPMAKRAEVTDWEMSS